MSTEKKVYYQKYRPTTLDGVFGQGHIKAVLNAAIEEDNLSHAYLFSGSRGVGKTSIARILANILEVAEIDLVEIDAASNRGIDDIRELRESAYFQPAQGDRKLYILDEVHMLTNEAFNALLKILEEPPSYSYFILCTTEPHKIPITVASRCQQLNFIPPTSEEIGEYIQQIAQKEDVVLPEGISEFIAKNADGSFRDALVLLEQVTSLLASDVKDIDGIHAALGFVKEETGKELLEHMTSGDTGHFMESYSALQEKGIDFTLVIDLLLSLIEQRILAGTIEPSNMTRDQYIELSRELIEVRFKSKFSKHVDVVFLNYVLDWMTPTAKVAVANEVTLPANGIEEPQDQTPPPVPSVDDETEKMDVQQTSEKAPGMDEDAPRVEGGDWEQILAIVKEESTGVEILLKAARAEKVNSNGVLLLLFDYEFHMKKVQEKQNWQFLQSVVTRVLGPEVQVTCEVKKRETTSSAVKDQDVAITIEAMHEDRGHSTGGNDDIFKAAQEVFGGQLVE